MSNKIVFKDAFFHDCYIHGISFNFVKEIYLGQEELLIDIDYIVSWPGCSDEHHHDNYFNISRAILKFEEIENVKINLHENARYIDRIEKVSNADISKTLIGNNKAKWLIYSFTGEVLIELDAVDMFVELIGKVHTIKNRQFLTSEERK